MNITPKKAYTIANTVYKSVKEKQTIPEIKNVSRYQLPYLMAKGVLHPKKTIVVGDIKAYTKQDWDYISRDVPRNDYLELAGRLVDYVNKHRQLPNYLTYNNIKISTAVYTYAFASIIVFYNIKERYPAYWTFNNKTFVKPTETTNEVYNYFVKKTGIKPTSLDDVCNWVKNKVTYQFYFDDEKSNKQVIDTKAGNCTDLLQFLINMAEALQYEWKVIHTQCAQSRTGHVYGKFRKKGASDWFIRDIACIADNSDYCVWCNVDTGAGYLLATNPSWFLENLHR